MDIETIRKEEKENWTELKSFHEVMKNTFHPIEEGNFKPIRARSREMAERAVILQNGVIPPSFNTPEIHQSIRNLAEGSSELHDMILNEAGDNAVSFKLSDVHDVFHTIQGLCKH
ncbi:MAG: hypothetical protein WCL00_04630 [Bacteroidota bacterium]